MSAPRIPDRAYESAFLASSPVGMTWEDSRRMLNVAARYIQSETLRWQGNSFQAMADIANAEGRLAEFRGWMTAARDCWAKANGLEKFSGMGGGSHVA